MISLLGQVCAIAEFSVSEIHASALYAGMRMDTSGFIAIAFLKWSHRRCG